MPEKSRPDIAPIHGAATVGYRLLRPRGSEHRRQNVRSSRTRATHVQRSASAQLVGASPGPLTAQRESHCVLRCSALRETQQCYSRRDRATSATRVARTVGYGFSSNLLVDPQHLEVLARAPALPPPGLLEAAPRWQFGSLRPCRPRGVRPCFRFSGGGS